MALGVEGTGAGSATAGCSKLLEDTLEIRVLETDSGAASLASLGVGTRAAVNVRRLSSSAEAEATRGLLICICMPSRERNGCGRST